MQTPDGPRGEADRTIPTGVPAYVRAAQSPEALDQLHRRGRRQVLFGVLWIIGGVAVTLYTLSFGASFYVVYWGAVLYGVVSVVLGLRKLMRDAPG